jgi:mRNA interferase MazF
MKEGSVVTAAFPQADGRFKLRPALVVRFTRPHADAVLCAISTQTHLAVAAFDEIIGDNDSAFATSGLRQTSLIRAGMLVTMPITHLPRELGFISPERFARLRTNLSRWFQPTEASPSS